MHRNQLRPVRGECGRGVLHRLGRNQSGNDPARLGVDQPDLAERVAESQEPAGNSMAKRGSEVTVTLKEAADGRVNVPDLSGKTYAEAAKELEAAGAREARPSRRWG